jgi:hypothetical protein
MPSTLLLTLACVLACAAELTGLVPKLSATGAAACRPDELSYYETKLVVIQVRQ